MNSLFDRRIYSRLSINRKTQDLKIRYQFQSSTDVSNLDLTTLSENGLLTTEHYEIVFIYRNVSVPEANERTDFEPLETFACVSTHMVYCQIISLLHNSFYKMNR